MKLNLNLKTLTATCFLAAFPATTLLADDGDSSASVSSGYASQILESHGVIVKVQTDGSGNVLTDSAEMRVVTTPQQPASGAEAKALWDTHSADVKVADVSTDSSTSWGWRYPGWNWGYNYGWRPAGYYYNNYYPSWNYGGNYYNYYRPNYYYNYNPYYGNYGYYYYPRGWY